MYIATVISKQWCRRFLEIWQWDILIIPLTRLGFTVASLVRLLREGAEESTGDFCLLFKGLKSQQIIGRQYSPKPSRKVVVELLRFYKKCDYYSWQYIAVVDDERCSPGVVFLLIAFADFIKLIWNFSIIGGWFMLSAWQGQQFWPQPIGTGEYHKSR